MTRRSSRTTQRALKNAIVDQYRSVQAPRLGIQLGGLDPDLLCAPPLRRGSSGVGSEEPRTRGFRVPTGGGWSANIMRTS